MRSSLSVVVSVLLAVPLTGQVLPPLPGFNIGLNPIASVGTIALGPTVGVYVVLPGNQANPLGSAFATFHDPAFLPPGTIKVRLSLLTAAVYDSRACAPGTGVFFDTQNPLSTGPFATIRAPGWNTLAASNWVFGFGPDPAFSTWYLGYCSVMSCTSPCGTNVRQPEWMFFVFLPTFS